MLRGGTAVSVADGKQCMIEGMQSGYNKGMLGLEDHSSDEEQPEVAQSSGIGCGLKRAGDGALTPAGNALQPSLIPGPWYPKATPPPAMTPKQKKEAAKQEKALAKLATKAAKQKAEEEAQEKAEADAAKKAKMAAVYLPGLFTLYVAVVLGPVNQNSCRYDNHVTCTTKYILRLHADISSLSIEALTLL